MTFIRFLDPENAVLVLSDGFEALRGESDLLAIPQLQWEEGDGGGRGEGGRGSGRPSRCSHRCCLHTTPPWVSVCESGLLSWIRRATLHPSHAYPPALVG